MPDAPNRLFIVKRLLIVATALAAFWLAFRLIPGLLNEKQFL
jgi:hypothetical protein